MIEWPYLPCKYTPESCLWTRIKETYWIRSETLKKKSSYFLEKASLGLPNLVSVKTWVPAMTALTEICFCFICFRMKHFPFVHIPIFYWKNCLESDIFKV